MVRSILIYLFVGLYVLTLGPIGMIWALITGNAAFLYRLARVCVLAAGWMGGIRVRVAGAEKIQPDLAYLFLSNHQANIDGPLIFYATRRHCRAVVKKEILHIPILSWVLRLASFVPIDRTDPKKARASIDRAAQLLRNGYSFFAFPEGTRSRDGRLGDFKKGVFIMAIKAGVPVMPVSICNSRAIQPPGHFQIKPGMVDIVFHNPIPTGHMQMQDREQLILLTREAIAQGL